MGHHRRYYHFHPIVRYRRVSTCTIQNQQGLASLGVSSCKCTLFYYVSAPFWNRFISATITYIQPFDIVLGQEKRPTNPSARLGSRRQSSTQRLLHELHATSASLRSKQAASVLCSSRWKHQDRSFAMEIRSHAAPS